MKTLTRAGADHVVDRDELRSTLEEAIADFGTLERVLLVPPDFTRYHSGAGEITELFYELLSPRAKVDVLPALGTHSAMPESLLRRMFGSIPLEAFHVHDWRDGVVRLGEVPGEFVHQVSDGKVDYPIHAEVGRLIAEGRYDRIISIGQVVPHEVIGMANQNKNIFVGTGGPDTINKTHFLGAVAGMENLMGREKSPVRDVLNYAEREFFADHVVTYVLTVREREASGDLVTRGLFIGEGDEGFLAACRLSQEVNIDLLEKPLDRVVVYLDPEEFHSTWLGNKSIYRTRMAMADDGELIVIAPGVKEFGEDAEIDRLIRAYGYRTTPEILEAVATHEELRGNLSAAAHLIHGNSEGRFRITYCTGGLSRQEVESVGYASGDIEEMQKRYPVAELQDGMQTRNGEEFFFISNPALGLWSTRERFVS